MRIDHRLSTEELKQERAKKVLNITVVIIRADGTELVFDGDEESQKRLDRFSRAASANGYTEIPWKMADNSTMMVTPDEMIQAMYLAAAKQGELWFV